MLRKIASGLNLILTPVIYLSGQFLLSRWQALEPDTIWFLSHTLLLIGAGLFVPTIAGLSNYLDTFSPILTSLGSTLATFGALALVGQFTIDLAVGHVASSQIEMSATMQHIQASRGMNIIFYFLAPVCFFIGQMVLILLLTFARLIPRWAGFVAAIGFVGLGLAISTSNVIFFYWVSQALRLELYVWAGRSFVTLETECMKRIKSLIQTVYSRILTQKRRTNEHIISIHKPTG